MALAEQRCVPCEGGVEAFTDAHEEELLKDVTDWELIREGTHHIRRTFTFKDFAEAMAFARQVGDIAESEQHHPDLHISYGKVIVELSTHKVKGLTKNDFIVAAKTDALPAAGRQEG